MIRLTSQLRSSVVRAMVAASVLALSDPDLAERLEAWRAAQTASVAERPETEA